MPLVKDTKTVLLHAGMQDHVDDFLIESPAVEYIENGRFDKDGVISKRQGFEALPSNELDPDTDGNPTVVVGGSRLVVPYDGGVATYSEQTGQWTTASSPVVFTENERVYSTQAGSGACHFHQAVLGDYTVIVYEVVKDVDLSLSSRRVYLEIIGPENQLISRNEYTGYYPQLAVPASTTQYVIFTYLSGSVGSESLVTRRVTASTGVVSSARTTSLDIAAWEHDLDGSRWYTDFTYSRNQEFLNWDKRKANYKLCATTTGAAVVYCEEVATGAAPKILYNLISANSATTAPTVGAQTTLKTESAPGDTSYNTTIKILGCAWRISTLYVLYAVYVANDNAASDEDEVFLRITDGSTTEDIESWSGYTYEFYDPSVTPTFYTTPVYSSGSVVSDGDQLWVVVSKLGLQTMLNEIDPAIDDPGLSEVVFYTVPYDLASSTRRRRRYGWRAASSLAVHDGSVYVCLQQQLQRFNNVLAKGSATDTVVSPTTSNTPLPTYLCKVTTTTLYPLSTLSANRGITASPFSGATSSTLPELISGSAGLRCLVPIQQEVAGAGFLKNASTLAGATEIKATSPGYRYAEVWSVSLSASPRPTPLGEGVLFSSGIPLWFDGTSFAESTPLCRPEILWVDGTTVYPPLQPSEGLVVADDVHQICALYSYVDRNGIIHRSAPGTIASIPRDAPGGGTNAETYTLYFSSPLSILDSTTQLTLEVYLLSEGVYKCISTVSVDPQINTEVYCDLNLEANGNPMVSSGKVLYTEAGLYADPIPYCTSIVPAAGRLVGITDDPRSTVVFSKPLETGVSPEFPVAFTFPLNPGTIVTGVAGLDDKIVVFTADEIYVLYGQGPTGTGRGSSFAIMRLPTPVGCTDTSSVVETPSGVMFRGRRGFYMLGRDLSVTPIHGASDILKGRTVIGATTLTKYGEVRFLLSTTGTTSDSDGPTPDSTRPPTPKYANSVSGSPALVYNYERNQWSVFTNYDGVSAALLNGVYCRLRSDYSVWRETEDNWADPTGDNLLKIVTPWIKLRNLQDYGRIYKATFLGRYLSTFTEDDNGDLDAGNIRIKVAFDYEKDDQQSKLFRADDELQPSYRDGEISSAERLQIVVVPKRQKCSAIRFTIEEEETPDANSLTYRIGQGFEIPAIDLEVGMRQGSNKSIGATRKK